jgi:hypothetical protein
MISFSSVTSRRNRNSGRVVVAAFALDRLDDQRRDVGACWPIASLISRPAVFGGDDFVHVFVEREGDFGVGNPRPVELRVPLRLHRVGVGHRHGVAAAAVEGFAKVDHLRAELLLLAALKVLLHLPVEGSLEGVLDSEGSALDQGMLGLAGDRKTIITRRTPPSAGCKSELEACSTPLSDAL